jgi:hypothetical protein
MAWAFSGEPVLVRRAIRQSPELEPALVSCLLPHLASEELFADVVRALRRAAPRATGQLVDALLDPAGDPKVRRRIPRVLKACPTGRAAEGLRAALDDPSFEIRASAAAALAALHERSGVVRVGREEVLGRVRRELDSGETVDRQLPQLFALLSLTLERGPLQIAWAAMKGQDRALRGTALESDPLGLRGEHRAPALLAAAGRAGRRRAARLVGRAQDRGAALAGARGRGLLSRSVSGGRLPCQPGPPAA